MYKSPPFPRLRFPPSHLLKLHPGNLDGCYRYQRTHPSRVGLPDNLWKNRNPCWEQVTERNTCNEFCIIEISILPISSSENTFVGQYSPIIAPVKHVVKCYHPPRSINVHNRSLIEQDNIIFLKAEERSLVTRREGHVILSTKKVSSSA